MWSNVSGRQWVLTLGRLRRENSEFENSMGNLVVLIKGYNISGTALRELQSLTDPHASLWGEGMYLTILAVGTHYSIAIRPCGPSFSSMRGWRQGCENVGNALYHCPSFLMQLLIYFSSWVNAALTNFFKCFSRNSKKYTSIVENLVTSSSSLQASQRLRAGVLHHLLMAVCS